MELFGDEVHSHLEMLFMNAFVLSWSSSIIVNAMHGWSCKGLKFLLIWKLYAWMLLKRHAT